jgi:hypothetical protein
VGRTARRTVTILLVRRARTHVLPQIRDGETRKAYSSSFVYVNPARTGLEACAREATARGSAGEGNPHNCEQQTTQVPIPFPVGALLFPATGLPDRALFPAPTRREGTVAWRAGRRGRREQMFQAQEDTKPS